MQNITVIHVFIRERLLLLLYKICDNHALNLEYKNRKKSTLKKKDSLVPLSTSTIIGILLPGISSVY